MGKTVKSKHKHQYVKCLLRINDKHISYALGNRCSVCGRTKITNMFITELDEETGCHAMLHNEEILNRNKDLEIYDFYWDSKYT